MQNYEHERRQKDSSRQNPMTSYGLITVSLVTFAYVSRMCPRPNLAKLFTAFYIQLPSC